MTVSTLLSLLSAGAVGAAAGYVGSLMVLRRMALVGDALSHVALPGLAVGLLLGFSPVLGAFAFVLVAAVLTWAIERAAGLPVEGIVGVLFVLALAVGLLLTPNPDLLEALFGDLAAVSLATTAVTVVVAAAILLLLRRLYPKIVLTVISPDLAASAGVATSLVSLLYLALVSATVAMAIQVSGTLLAGALVIVPAVSAKLVGPSLRAFSGLSLGFGVVTATGGVGLALGLNVPPGPVVVLLGVGVFLAALAWRGLRGTAPTRRADPGAADGPGRRPGPRS